MIRNNHQWMKRGLTAVALFSVGLLLCSEVWSTTLRPPRGGRRGGHVKHSSPRHRGSVRSHGRGSVRHHRHSYSPRRSRSAGRPSSMRSPRSSPSRRGARSSVQRTPSHGSLRGSSNVARSFADRQRGPGPDSRRPLSDIGRDRDPQERREEARERREERRDHRRERRAELTEHAIRYPYRGGYYYYDDDYWWEPYYDDDDVEYILVYPDEGLILDELGDDAEEIITDDGTYYESNGVYYEKTTDGQYATVDKPDTGELDPVTIVRRACDFLSRQQEFTIVVDDTMDHVQDSGQKLQSHTTRTIHLRRPDRLAATGKGDDIDRSIWYDGQTVTVLDRLEGVYARTQAPDTIDAMLDVVVAQLGVSLPLTDLMYSDPYALMSGALQQGQYLGLTDVNGTMCHHLSFSTGDVDWQLWVDSGEQAAPKMIAITYNDAPQTPTYAGEIVEWDRSPDFTLATFDASIPSGVEQIPFITPQNEVKRLQNELDKLRDANRRVDEYVAAQKTIQLYSQIADRPEGAKRIATEQARLKEIGEVSQEEIDAYLEQKKALRKQLDEARRGARGS